MTQNSCMGPIQPELAERAIALRAEALEICDRSAWTPRCIGTGDFEMGVREIYAEVCELQKVRAIYISQNLIDCSLKYNFWFPLFEDVEARIWMFLGDYKRAEERWGSLLNHQDEVLRRIAEQAMVSLKNQIESGVMLSQMVDQLFDKGDREQVIHILTQALIQVPPVKNLDAVLEAMAMRWPMPADFPWDRDLFTDQLRLELLENQLKTWEQSIDE